MAAQIKISCLKFNQWILSTILDYSENEIRRRKGKITEKHTFYIRKGNLKGLEKLRDQYGLSLFRLANMAIRNVWNHSEKIEKE